MTQFATKSEKVNPFTFPSDYTRTMKNQPKYKWFKPILALLLFLVLYVVFNCIVEVISAFYHSVAVDPATVVLANDAYLKTDFSNPIDVFLTAANVAILIPAAAIAVKATGLGTLGTLSSVAGHLRWDLLKKIALPLFLISLVLISAMQLIPAAIDGSLADLGELRFPVLAMIAVIVFVPFQAAAEEYAFRGIIFQAFGSWIPVVVITCILQALIFGGMHGYNIVGNIGIVINGFIWGWLILKTGGLEASICLHAANNVVGMLFTCVSAQAAVTTTVSIESLAIEVVFHLIMAVIAFALCKRHGYIISDKQPAPAIEEPKESEQA